MGDSNRSNKPSKKVIKTKVLRIGKKRIKLSRVVDVKRTDEIDEESLQRTKKLPSITDNGPRKKGLVGLYQRFKEKNSKRTKGWRIFWQAFWIAVAAGCVMIVVGIGLAVTWMINAPELDMTKFDFNSATTIYDINGDYYQQLQTAESRIPVEIEDVPEVVQLAFVAIEDQRFYSHNGVDIRGTVKAVLSVLFSGSTSGPGGSTITQQLIKLTHLTSEVSIKRKVMEWKLAIQLEKKMTKREILEAYLNKVNMSYTWGIQSAAKLYFDKDVSQLTIAQAAVLAAIINSPSYYNPYLYETDADGNTILSRTQHEDGTYKIAYDSDNMDRALTVIYKMHQLGFISDEEYEIAKNDLENNLIALVEPTDTTIYSYFTDAVYQQVLDDIMEKYNYTEDAATDLLLNGGLIINSTVDPIIQNALEVTANNDANFPSQTSSAANASAAMTEYSGVETNYIPQVAAVVIENQTGYVVGIVGGRGEKSGNLTRNRALMKHPTGSATKPITVYSPGIDTGILTMATTFDNNKIDFGGWVVKNSPATYTGMMTCRAALVGSVNVVAVQAQRLVGNEISADYAERFGFEIVRDGTSNDMNSAALALGGYTYGQTTLALASAYTVFPNGGYRITPTFYTTVTDSNGVVILTAEQETIQVISEQTAWIMTSALKQVVKGGTT
jgi:penicillin-binding protein 1A